jgi:hypothetical protein
MLADVIREVVADLKGLPGLGSWHEQPPEQLNGPWPMLLAYPEAGSVRLYTTRSERDRPASLGIHTITVLVLAPRKGLPYDVAALLDYADLVPERLLAGFVRDRFGGSVTALGDATSPGASAAIRYEFTPDQWGGLDLLAWKWSFDVSVEASIEEAIP